MKLILPATFLVLCSLASAASDGLTTRNPNAAAPAAQAGTTFDAAKELPRYPAVETKDAVATWKVKAGYKIQLAANEPQVRDPVAISFDENGRMFVCEMVDYSEQRHVTPHLGRISVLEDKDGDGFYETSRVFADNLPLPTGLIWANGGLFVAATPDIWRFEDRDGDGRAEVREKVFTGFGTGLKALNVQAMLNSFQWGQDNRIHVQGGSGNRGKISSPKRPDLPAEEIASRDFWFDPRTYAFGFEAGGAQYGMSFDNYGRKFACSNSDHLQFFVYDDRYSGRNPFFSMPPTRQSIAADGGAAEVHRISPDEPWRIVRTRWRIGGVVKGVVEGGGRVSGYFTGATGTTVYRGDAYGEGFVNNTFSGDAGGALIHRKKLSTDGVSLIGRRPADEQNYEFAASTDTWVRTVNFANAPDGTLHVCDMYREVIEHPWSLPEEIKQHIDLNSGNDRGRIYRIIPRHYVLAAPRPVQLGTAPTAELVALLEHPNGWHRDTASRLLYERQDKTAAPLLAKLMRDSKSPLAKHHALGALDGLGALSEEPVIAGLAASDARLREHAIVYAEKLLARGALPALAEKLTALVNDADARVRFQLALTLPAAPTLSAVFAKLAARDFADTWISAALLSAPPAFVNSALFPAFTGDLATAKNPPPSSPSSSRFAPLENPPRATRRSSPSCPSPAPARSGSVPSATACDAPARVSTRLIRTKNSPPSSPVPLPPPQIPRPHPPPVSKPSSCSTSRPLRRPASRSSPASRPSSPRPCSPPRSAPSRSTRRPRPPPLLRNWPNLAPAAKDAALTALTAREDRATALLEAVKAGAIKPAEIPASQVQSLANHKNTKIAALAATTLASVIPPSRAEVTAKFQPSVTAAGDAKLGHVQFQTRCIVCHRAGTEGLVVGPDLNTVKSKGREALLTAILEPHKEIAPQYIAYDVTTKDGNAYTGIISRDEAASLSLRIMGGGEITLARANLRGSTSSGKSLMPEGLEAGMSVKDMADLLTFIESL